VVTAWRSASDRGCGTTGGSPPRTCSGTIRSGRSFIPLTQHQRGRAAGDPHDPVRVLPSRRDCATDRALRCVLPAKGVGRAFAARARRPGLIPLGNWLGHADHMMIDSWERPGVRDGVCVAAFLAAIGAALHPGLHSVAIFNQCRCVEATPPSRAARQGGPHVGS
jgi:hypothetical protein